MLKETSLVAFFNILNLIVVAVATITVARVFGPSSFGQYAALQSISAIITIFVTLRIDTRIATCGSTNQLSLIVSAAGTSSILFVLIGLLITPVASIYFDYVIILALITLAASSAVNEVLMSSYSYKGEIWKIIKYRSLRQMFPACTVLLFTFLYQNIIISIISLAISTFICTIVLIIPLKSLFKLSFTGFFRTIKYYSSELRASLMLTGVNAVWLNGLIPLMNIMGLSYIAGQYALIQRLINAPLGVMALAIRSTLLKKGNDMHEEGRNIRNTVLILFTVAILISTIAYWLLYVQDIVAFPDEWRLEKMLFLASVFFSSCSFAVGSVSIVGVRLKDEWFLAYWQLTFIVIWVIVLFIFHSNLAFIYILAIGGCGYWILFIRWIMLAETQRD